MLNGPSARFWIETSKLEPKLGPLLSSSFLPQERGEGGGNRGRNIPSRSILLKSKKKIE